ncbi:hypothetical protein BFJ63_vAg17288 [Fusarium oxysporum f. sp. narcissi]|uniref:Uncharacterized protein n=1 Tax=Fusarium oxysporum f. sp. narcissi TaxID=451672 RepID=A0A4Q2V7C1_FUSOX|nr:hypothetical protein BFJ63_vAg17288 [Fusarium oxysporum f. sp. narcissi]
MESQGDYTLPTGTLAPSSCPAPPTRGKVPPWGFRRIPRTIQPRRRADDLLVRTTQST